MKNLADFLCRQQLPNPQILMNSYIQNISVSIIPNNIVIIIHRNKKDGKEERGAGENVFHQNR